MFSTTSGCRSVNGFSKVKARLDVAMQRLHGEADIRPWVIHDIRRTVRSRLSELRVPPVVAELVIGHQLPGLLRVYDQWEHLDEKRDALTRWANHLREIVGAVPCAKREPQSNRLITVAAVGVSS